MVLSTLDQPTLLALNGEQIMHGSIKGSRCGLLADHSVKLHLQGLPAGSRVTLFNSHEWSEEHLGG